MASLNQNWLKQRNEFLGEDPIFVSIAAYRDPELITTVQTAIETALFPQRLRFGIVWQGEALSNQAHNYLESIKALSLEFTQSKGAGWARAITQTLWRGEPYWLQIDAHTRFVPGWDAQCIKWLNRCRDRSEFGKPILSAYLPYWERLPDSTEHRSNIAQALDIDCNDLHKWGVPLLKAGNYLNHLSEPYPNRFISAHFIFADSSLITDVPYDPLIYFHGEEISLSVRAYTHGYNVFNPHIPLMMHRYNRTGRVCHWDDNPDWFRLDAVSKQRVKQVLGWVPGIEQLGRFGNGTIRQNWLQSSLVA